MISNFQIEYGNETDGVNKAALIRVPVRYGDASRNAQVILQENSRNSMPASPLMTFYISSLTYDRPRMQDPTFVSKINVRQRTYDPDTDPGLETLSISLITGSPYIYFKLISIVSKLFSFETVYS
jgi:hypothetical protein